MQDGPHLETVAVTMNEILLRGCTLKNSGFVIGLVVYTGPESRIQMNAAEPPRKQGAETLTASCFHGPDTASADLMSSNSCFLACPCHALELLALSGCHTFRPSSQATVMLLMVRPTGAHVLCSCAGSYTRFLNLQVLLIIVLQMLLCAACAGAALAWRNSKGDDWSEDTTNVSALPLIYYCSPLATQHIAKQQGFQLKSPSFRRHVLQPPHLPPRRSPRVLCASAARDRYYFAENSYTQGNYKSNVAYFFVTMVTFWLLYSYLVPISLFVTIEIVKFIQVRVSPLLFDC